MLERSVPQKHEISSFTKFNLALHSFKKFAHLLLNLKLAYLEFTSELIWLTLVDEISSCWHCLLFLLSLCLSVCPSLSLSSFANKSVWQFTNQASPAQFQWHTHLFLTPHNVASGKFSFVVNLTKYEIQTPWPLIFNVHHWTVSRNPPPRPQVSDHPIFYFISFMRAERK